MSILLQLSKIVFLYKQFNFFSIIPCVFLSSSSKVGYTYITNLINIYIYIYIQLSMSNHCQMSIVTWHWANIALNCWTMTSLWCFICLPSKRLTLLFWDFWRHHSLSRTFPGNSGARTQSNTNDAALLHSATRLHQASTASAAEQ